MLLYVRCSAETAIINLMGFLIHVVLRSGAEIGCLSKNVTAVHAFFLFKRLELHSFTLVKVLTNFLCG